jgi:tetratricopeptide (TPR) repeat protein
MILRFWSSPLGAGASAPTIVLSPELFLDLISEMSHDYHGEFALLVLGPLFLVGLIMLVRQNRHKFSFACLIFVVPILALWIIQPGHNFGAKYVIFQLPIFFAVTAYGITGIDHDRARRILPALLVRRPILQTLLLVGAVLINLVALREWLTFETEDWKAAAAFLSASLEPDDLVVCEGQYSGRGGDGPRTRIGLKLYIDTQPHGVQFVREAHARDALPQNAETARRMWAALWHQYPVKWQPDARWAVAEFTEVTILRQAMREPRPAREELFALLMALLKMQPLPEGEPDLLLALESISLCAPGQPAPIAGPPATSAAAIAAECADLGYGYQVADRLDRAESYYRQAIALAPANAYYYLRLGDVCCLQSQADEAGDAYRQALALIPDYEEAWQKLMRLQP